MLNLTNFKSEANTILDRLEYTGGITDEDSANWVDDCISALKKNWPYMSSEQAWQLYDAWHREEEPKISFNDIVFVNLTPHKIVIHSDDYADIEELEPEAIPVRVESKKEQVGDLQGFPIWKTEMGELTGLPEPQPGVVFIVSALVAAQIKREDIMSPGELIRDEKGNVIGCRGLVSYVENF